MILLIYVKLILIFKFKFISYQLMSVFNNISIGLESACNLFIRPEKQDYKLDELGKTPFKHTKILKDHKVSDLVIG